LYVEKGLFKAIIQSPILIILSTVFKPPLGVYDFAYCFIKGVGTAIFPDYSMLRFRRRPPRIFGEDGLIIPYNYDHAVGNDYIRRLGYSVTDSEEFKYFDRGDWKINGKRDHFAVILTDRRLYVVIIKKYNVKRFAMVKLHKIKSAEIEEKGFNQAEVTIHTHVKNEDGKHTYKVTRMDLIKGREFVSMLKEVMQTLQMDIEIKAIVKREHE
jgi:hypothetical protein